MFEKVKIPERLDNDTIVEAVLEIRYKTSCSMPFILGKIATSLFQSEPDSIKELPILQLPEDIRKSDSNLKYKPFYKVVNGNNVFQFGPNVVLFSNLKPYSTWKEWKAFFLKKIKELNEIKLWDEVEYISLRYIDFIEDNIIPKLNCKFLLDNSQITNPIRFNTQLRLENSLIANNLTISYPCEFKQASLKSIKGTIIDVTSNLNKTWECEEFNLQFEEKLDEIHKQSKIVFFGILGGFVNELKPKYD